jgi:peroxiredoxin
VIGVSEDPQERSDAFRKSLDLPYPLVGDEKGAITSAYKVRWPIVGHARRATFVIDPKRRIRMAFWSELNPDQHVVEACATAETIS